MKLKIRNIGISNNNNYNNNNRIKPYPATNIYIYRTTRVNDENY